MKDAQLHLVYRTPSGQHEHVGPWEDAPLAHLRLLCKQQPFAAGIRWQVRLEPRTDQLAIVSLVLTLPWPVAASEPCFVNGYQTWTESRFFAPQDRLQGLNPWWRPVWRRYRMQQYGDYFFRAYSGKPGQFHSHTYTYVRSGSTCRFIGAVGEEAGFTVFQYDVPAQQLCAEVDAEGLRLDAPVAILDLVTATGTPRAVFDAWASQQPRPRPSVPVITGWTSWYQYYTGITEAIVQENLAAFVKHRVPIDLFQIDDGYQQAVGDWLTPDATFPSGMQAAAAAIHAAGYRAGLWLAPFICERDSAVFRQHPDWVCRGTDGKPVEAGFSPGWSGPFYALDLQQAAVRAYLREVFSVVLETWGFDFVKLDFLYAAALLPPAGRTRGQAMAEAMDFLAETVGPARILACGVPLASAFGRVGYCRIGSDVALKWEDRLLARHLRYRERVSTWNALTSALGRAWLNGRTFANDPDVFILREGTALTPAQRHTLFVLNLALGDLVFTSDALDAYDPDTRRLYLSQFPLRPRTLATLTNEGEAYILTFEAEDAVYLVAANLGDRACEVGLPEGRYFHPEAVVHGRLRLVPYVTRCFRRIEADEWCVLGSDTHVFPGMDVRSLTVAGGEAQVGRWPEARNAGIVYIHVPEAVEALTISGVPNPARVHHGVRCVAAPLPPA